LFVPRLSQEESPIGDTLFFGKSLNDQQHRDDLLIISEVSRVEGDRPLICHLLSAIFFEIRP